MKILYFTFNVPSETFGGGICILQSLFSISQFADVDYVGPEFESEELAKYGIKLSNIYCIHHSNNLILRFVNTLFYGISTGFYQSWKKVIHSLEISQYECIFMDSTRQDFVVRWAKQFSKPIIIRAHNVEIDYFEAMYRNDRKFSVLIHKNIIKRSERELFRFADYIIALTENDRKRFIELYGGDEKRISVVPICIKPFNQDLYERLPEPFIAITGSLWFGPNAHGTEWFLDKVWRNIGEDILSKYSLVIAGSNPSEKITELARQLPKVNLYPNPDCIDAFYQQASVYVAPIFYGAGMKVKVAEALSCGIPVVTTKHAFSGYEAAADGIYLANTEDQFKEQLLKIARFTDYEMEEHKRRISDIFHSNFSMERSAVCMRTIIEDLMNRKYRL